MSSERRDEELELESMDYLSGRAVQLRLEAMVSGAWMRVQGSSALR